MNSEAVIEVSGIKKVFGQEETRVEALRGVDMTVNRGDFMAIVGPSGSGKSTLLNIMGGLDDATSGDVKLGGKRISEMKAADLSNYRRDHVGLIFQAYNLIPVLTVSENIEYVMLLQGVPPSERKARVAAILGKVGLAGKEDRFPAHLSGGQQQRVAIARAMVSNPDIIFADEPTANLDSKTGQELIDMMHSLNKNENMTFVFSTHDEKIMKKAERLVVLEDGKIISDERKKS